MTLTQSYIDSRGGLPCVSGFGNGSDYADQIDAAIRQDQRRAAMSLRRRLLVEADYLDATAAQGFTVYPLERLELCLEALAAGMSHPALYVTMDGLRACVDFDSNYDRLPELAAMYRAMAEAA